ncbi:restriction endonuclease subunit S [Rhodoferax saidenbachensis]|uniref:Type I restriction enzyme S subunit n=1 Tax=Rhodoferax saidenbachensis TaxID=1484693 RepID=A0ABU1ZPX8_9BURK|nr:restriction endonuclease subunit S [Rhodoferax saidenbachensis]MDR7307590.1 type I restriction enzyme S subunit [Rhodoferax saidenbachensis]
MNLRMLLSNLNLLAAAPDGVAKLRELILTLAVQGKLVPQDPSDEPASALLKKIRAEKDRLIAEGKIKRDKPLAEIAVEEKPFALPTGWEWVPLQYIGYTQTGTTPDKKNPEFYGTYIPFIKPGDIYPGYVDYDNEALSERGLQDSGRAAPAGSILMVCIGTIGKTNIIERDCSFNQQINSITPLCCLPEFISLYLRCPEFQSQAWSRSASTTIAILNKGNWEQIPVALAPLAEQFRIVTRVEELMRLCDALEAKACLEATQHEQLVRTLLGTLTSSTTPEELANNWHRVATHFDLLLDRPEAVDALEQTILQLAVRGLLVPQDPQDEPASELLKKIRAEKDRLIAEGKIKRDKPLPPIAEDEEPPMLPQGWEVARFGDYFFELCTGPFGSVIHKEDYVEGGVPLINPSHMIGGRISHDPSVSVSPAMAGQLGAYRLTAGDIVLARRGEVGRYALVTDDEDGWLCGTGSFFVKLHEVCNREFLGLVFEDPDLRKHLLGESVGSTMTNLNQRILIETPIALPPLAEQSRIVARVASLRALCADLRQRLTTARTQQALLAEVLVQTVAA